MACTKEVSLITEVEFQLFEQHSAEGYINQGLPTTFTIVPEDTLKNYEYTITYEILDGKGHFEDMDGNLLESGKGQSFPTNLISSLMYRGSKIGAHRIKIVGSDNFGLSEEIEVTYNLSDVPVVWEASSELSELELDKPAGLSLLLGTDNTAEDITYEAIYGFVPGPGILVPSQENGYVPTGEYNPIFAGNYPLVFTPSEVGPQQLTFTLRDNNGQEIETILDFNVVEFIDIISITIEPASANISVDETRNLELVITPANASNQNVSWSSSNEAIATVDATGLVTGISQGSVTIIASANDSSQVVGTASITIGSEDVALTDITVMPSPVSLNTGSTQQLTIDFEPTNATNKNVTWSTSNPTKATVSNTGLVTTLEVGSVTITATSDADTSIFGNSAITINEINNGPIARAGLDQTITLPTNSATLDGSGSSDTAPGTIISYQWSQIDSSTGAIATISNADVALTTVSDLTEGSYTFKLTVTDDQNATHTDDIVITVGALPNVAPVARAGLDQVITLPTSTVTLDGSGSSDTAPGNIDTYAWTQISGPTTANIVSANSASTSVNGLTEGDYTFRLTVIDDGAQALSHTDDIIITVGALPNVGPIARAGLDQVITLPTSTVTLDGSGSSDTAPGNIDTYAWTQISGPTMANIVSANSASTSVTGLAEGNYTFRLTVTDDGTSPLSHEDEIIVRVKEYTPPPATITYNESTGVYTAPAGSTVTVTLRSYGTGKGNASVSGGGSADTSWNKSGSIEFTETDFYEFDMPSSGNVTFSSSHMEIIATSQSSVTIENDEGATKSFTVVKNNGIP
ncbi:Ig-like domain-containing protein [Zobellia nedashkovskayae]